MVKEKYQSDFEKVRYANNLTIIIKQLKKNSLSSFMISVFLLGMLTNDSINEVFVKNKNARNTS